MRQLNRGAAVVLVLTIGLLTPEARVFESERHVYVTVLDRDGTPISGLTAEHFAVREDGRDRAVIRVQPLDTPAHVAVIIDPSFGASVQIETFRTAVGEFVTRLAAFHNVALYTVADRPTRVTAFTRDAAQLRAEVDRLFARPDSRTYLIDTIDVVLADTASLEPARPVIVAIATENLEASNRTAATVMKQLVARATSFHAIQIATATGATAAGRMIADRDVPARSQQLGRVMTVGEGDRERNRLLEQGTSLTAGSLQRIMNASALATPLSRIASEFAYSYRVTFAGPTPDKKLRDLQIGVLVEDVKVRAIAAPDMAMQKR
jgi:VWFA-related protein